MTDETSSAAEPAKPIAWSDLADDLTGMVHVSTTGPTGVPHVSLVACFEHDGEIWFATNADSAKAQNLILNPRIAMMWNPGREIYLWGTAELISDDGEKQRVWASGMLPYDPAMFFGTPDNPNMTLVRVLPQRVTSVVMGEAPSRWDRGGEESETQIPETALVTGGNRGIGFEVCRQLAQLGARVYLGSRDPASGESAAETLRGEGLDVTAVQLDVTDAASVDAARHYIGETEKNLDALINNAGGGFDWMHEVIGCDVDEVIATADANCFGTMRVTNAFVDLLKKSPHPRIVNVSSEAGSHLSQQGLSRQMNNLAGYAVAKAALHAYTVKLASALADSNVVVNAISPGFVATQPGSEKMGARPIPDGARSVVWGATLPDDAPSGKFFRDGTELAF